jgi:hypothetical protein
MVRISDIVSSLLRGITMARIQSDVFSSQASLEYLKDTTLKSYPVPRAEIRQADINMKVSVLETVQKNVDTNTIALDVMTKGLPEYVNMLLAIQVKPTSGSPTTEYKPLKDYLGDAASTAAITEEIRAQFDAYITQNIATLYPALIGSPRKFGSTTWQTETVTVLQTVMTAHQITVYLAGTTFTKDASNASIAWSETTAPAVQFAIDVGMASFFDLDLAVKKDQILTLPEHVMSELRLTVVIENYEWTTIKDKQGNTINRLTHK